MNLLKYYSLLLSFLPLQTALTFTSRGADGSFFSKDQFIYILSFLLCFFLIVLFKILYDRKKLLLKLSEDNEIINTPSIIEEIHFEPNELSNYQNCINAFSEAAFESVILYSKQGLIFDANINCCILTGFSKEELIGKNILSLFSADQKEKASRIIQDKDGLEQEEIHELSILNKDKVQKKVEIISKPFVFNNKQIFVAFILDVNKKALKEQSISESLNFLNALLETIPNPFFCTSSLNILLGCNKAFCDFIGKSKEEIIGLSTFELFDKETAENFYEKDSLILQDLNEQNYELDLNGKNMLIYKAVFKSHSEQGEGVITVMLDLTNRKQTEKALKKSRQLFHQFGENVDDVVWISENDNFLYINDAFEKFWGESKIDLLKNPEFFFTPIIEEDKERVLKSFNSNYYKESGKLNRTFRIFNKTTQERRWIWVRTFPIFNEESQMYRVAGLAQDITLQREIEQNILNSRQQYQELVDSISGIIWEADLENLKLNFVSPKVKQITGYTDTQWVNNPELWKDLIYPDDREFFDAMIQSIANKEFKHSEVEYRMFTKNKGLIWVRNLITVVYDDNTPSKMRGVISDITRYRKSQEKILEYTKNIQNDLKKQRESLLKAQAIQRNLNTQYLTSATNTDAIAAYIPSEEVGGDFFEVSKKDDLIIIIMGDCTGHGLDAAMDSVLSKSVCDRYSHFLHQKKPSLFLQHVNKDIISYFQNENFLTLFACVIDSVEKTITYSNANGELPFLLRKKKATQLPSLIGFHIGFILDQDYEEKTIDLENDDILIFCSDAVRELDIDGEKLLGTHGTTAIIENFKANLKNSFDFMLNSLKEKNKGFPLEDDLTLVLLQIKENEKQIYKISALHEVSLVESKLSKLLNEFNYSETESEQIIISVEEMIVNAISHGNQECPDKFVTIEAEIGFEKAFISIEDEGDGFDPEKLADPADFEQLENFLHLNKVAAYSHGRGVFLCRYYMDSCYYNQKGNKVNMIKSRKIQKTYFYDENNI